MLYKAIFSVDIPLHRPKKYALYMVGSSNKSVSVAWPLSKWHLFVGKTRQRRT